MTIEAKKNVKGAKTLKFAGLKTTPSRPTDAQLAQINQFTRRPFTADEIYVGQMRLANNAIDRDNERFSEEVLTRFAATAIRKTMLFDHSRDSQDSAVGKFFDVTIEKVALQQANAETGEDLMLPAGVTEVWFLCPWFFIPVKGVDEEVIVKIDAGIYDFCSIGFRCESMMPVMDKEGKILFWEYRGTGSRTEMTEGSLVYLGAQHGMSVKSNDKEIPGEGTVGAGLKPTLNPNEGGQKMNILLEKLKGLYGKTFSEGGLFDEIKSLVSEKVAAVEEAAKTAKAALDAKVSELEAKVKELAPLAEDGKAFRDEICAKYATLKAKICDVDDKPETREKTLTLAKSFGMDFLRAEIAVLEKRVAEKFPAESQLGGEKDPEGKSKSPGAKVNPLIPGKEK